MLKFKFRLTSKHRKLLKKTPEPTDCVIASSKTIASILQKYTFFTVVWIPERYSENKSFIKSICNISYYSYNEGNLMDWSFFSEITALVLDASENILKLLNLWLSSSKSFKTDLSLFSVLHKNKLYLRSKRLKSVDKSDDRLFFWINFSCFLLETEKVFQNTC